MRAQYSVSIPPLADAKTTFRSDQAWRIRALGASFHALAEVHMPGWRAWVTQTGSSWAAATSAILDRLAAAIHDSDGTVDASEPGIGACAASAS